MVAWDRELKIVHRRLRRALEVARESVDRASVIPNDLLLYCHGFCLALRGHHRAEDRELFPLLVSRNPGLAPSISRLRQDHEMIAHLLIELDQAVGRAEPPDVVRSHLDGVTAIMESHFRYEERELLGPLAAMSLPTDPSSALGPL